MKTYLITKDELDDFVDFIKGHDSWEKEYGWPYAISNIRGRIQAEKPSSAITLKEWLKYCSKCEYGDIIKAAILYASNTPCTDCGKENNFKLFKKSNNKSAK